MLNPRAYPDNDPMKTSDKSEIVLNQIAMRASKLAEKSITDLAHKISDIPQIDFICFHSYVHQKAKTFKRHPRKNKTFVSLERIYVSWK